MKNKVCEKSLQSHNAGEKSDSDIGTASETRSHHWSSSARTTREPHEGRHQWTKVVIMFSIWSDDDIDQGHDDD